MSRVLGVNIVLNSFIKICFVSLVFIPSMVMAVSWPFPPLPNPFPGPTAPVDPIFVEEVKWGLKEIKHVRVVFNKDPARNAEIIWKAVTNDLSEVKLYIDTVDYGENLEKYSYKIPIKRLTNYRGVYSASVSLGKLKPNTKYFFMIEDAKYGYKSKRYWFRTTSSSSKDPLYIVAGGDSRNNRIVRRKSNFMVKKLRPDAVFFGGDFTIRGWHGQWMGWLDDWSFTYGDDGRVTPIVVTRGNHEYQPEAIELLFNSPVGSYYNVNFNENLLNLFVLNTEISMAGNQLEWLKGALQKSENNLWKFAIYHRSVRPHTASKSEGWQQYRFWAPLFYQHGVDLVVESDTHVMKTTWPVRPSQEENSDEGFIRDDIRGTVYVGEGTWGAPLKPLNDAKSWTRSSASINQLKWIKVTRDKVTVRTVLSENAADVESVKNNSRYAIPKNLKLFKGDGGEISIFQRSIRHRLDK